MTEDSLNFINKKKPGRPRKSACTSNIPIVGIVDTPISTTNMIEITYNNPIYLKKIISLYKSYTCTNMYIKIDHTSITIFAIDHQSKVHIYTDIDAHCINTYYCKTPVIFTALRSDLDIVFNVINKTTNEISFVFEESKRSQLIILIRNKEYNITEKFEVPVQEIRGDSIPTRPNCSDYPISFKISSKSLKDRLGNVNKTDVKTIFIQKCGKEPLQIVCDTNRITWAGVYNDPAKIEFKSKLQENDIFAVCVNVDSLYDFSNNILGNDVIITADKHKKLSFLTYLDECKENVYAIHINVFIEIINYSV